MNAAKMITLGLLGGRAPRRGDYYVRKTGNDSTGDGSRSNPWLTINKALVTIPIGGNKTVVIGDGEYAEDSGSGYLSITRTFTGPVSFVGENKSAARVIIHNASGTSYNTFFQVTTPIYTFEDLTFSMRVKEGTSGALRIVHTDNGVTFNRCIFTGLTDATARQAVLISPSGANNVESVVFNNCVFGMVGAQDSYGVDMNPGGGLIDGVTFNSCSGSAVQYGLWVRQGCLDVNVYGGSWSNTGAGAGLIYGTDAQTPTANMTGTISGAAISSPASHACLIGCRLGGVVTVTGCTVTGGDYGLVVKENAGTVVTNNTIQQGSVGSLYFKGATGTTATGNTINNTIGGKCIQALAGSTGNKVGTLTVTGNTVSGGGASAIFNWGDNTHDSGGCVVNNNTYTPGGSGLYGAVRADADVQTITELRAAWSGYGDGSNDSTSTTTSV